MGRIDLGEMRKNLRTALGAVDALERQLDESSPMGGHTDVDMARSNLISLGRAYGFGRADLEGHDG